MHWSTVYDERTLFEGGIITITTKHSEEFIGIISSLSRESNKKLTLKDLWVNLKWLAKNIDGVLTPSNNYQGSISLDFFMNNLVKNPDGSISSFTEAHEEITIYPRGVKRIAQHEVVGLKNYLRRQKYQQVKKEAYLKSRRIIVLPAIDPKISGYTPRPKYVDEIWKNAKPYDILLRPWYYEDKMSQVQCDVNLCRADGERLSKSDIKCHYDGIVIPPYHMYNIFLPTKMVATLMEQLFKNRTMVSYNREVEVK